jgi:phosphotransferase system HPr (HPr) family protein
MAICRRSERARAFFASCETLVVEYSHGTCLSALAEYRCPFESGAIVTERNTFVKNAHGIHLRPSNVIVSHLADYPGEVRLSTPKGEASLRSIMELLTLSLEQGTEITISVSGPDEESVCGELVELFQTEFDFPSQD